MTTIQGSLKSLDDWLQHIQSVHFRSIDLSLDRVRRVSHALRIRRPPAVITIAGTNGKGSSVAMLDSIYRYAGYRIGAYTSPHLVDYNERIRIDGENVSDDELCRAFASIEEARGSIPLTYFEFSTLAALLVFQRRQVEIALLEVGMGGRLDAVNIIDADAALITSIDLDHTQWLGPTRDAIGREKAGIFRRNCWAICNDRKSPESLVAIARERQSRYLQQGRDYDFNDQGHTWSWWRKSTAEDLSHRFADLPRPSLPGDFQLENASGVLAVLTCLAKTRPVDAENIRQGLANTCLNGRLQVISRKPLVVIDVAHNAQSVAELDRFLQQNPVTGQTSAVFGMLVDKTPEAFIGELAHHIDTWHLAGIEGERGGTAQALAARIEPQLGSPSITCHADATTAYCVARETVQPQDRLVVFGSFYVAGDIIRFLTNPTV